MAPWKRKIFFFIVLKFLLIFRLDIHQYTIPLCHDLYIILRWCQCVDKSISGVEIPRCCFPPFSVNKLAVQSSGFAFPKLWMYENMHFFCGVSLFILNIAYLRPAFPCVSIVLPCHTPEDTRSERILIQILQTSINYHLWPESGNYLWPERGNPEYFCYLLLLHCIVTLKNTREQGIYSQDVWKVWSNWRAKFC